MVVLTYRTYLSIVPEGAILHKFATHFSIIRGFCPLFARIARFSAHFSAAERPLLYSAAARPLLYFHARVGVGNKGVSRGQKTGPPVGVVNLEILPNVVIGVA